MKRIIIFLGVLFFCSFVIADTTFFDQDNFFIMGVATTTNGDVIGETIGTSSCNYEWECTKWSICFPDGKQIRECVNLGTCSNTFKPPEIEQNCNYLDSSANIEEDEIENKPEVETSEGIKITGNIIGENISSENKIFIYFITALIIISIIFYLKRDYLKKLIGKIKYKFGIYSS